jgi:hypothetical protein
MKILINETQYKKTLLNEFGRVMNEPKDWFSTLYEWTSDPVLKGDINEIKAYDVDGKYLGYYDKKGDFGFVVGESWSPEMEQDLKAFHGKKLKVTEEQYKRLNLGDLGDEELTEEKGLWDNIRAKRERGEKPAEPGDEDYPDQKQWKKLTKKSKKK